MIKKIINRCKAHRKGKSANRIAMMEAESLREKAFLAEQAAFLASEQNAFAEAEERRRTDAIETLYDAPAVPERAAEAAPVESALPAVSGMRSDAPAAPARTAMPLSNDGAAWAEWDRGQRVRAEANAARLEAFLASAPWNKYGVPDVDRITEHHGYCSESLIAFYERKGRPAVSTEPTSLAAGAGAYSFS